MMGKRLGFVMALVLLLALAIPGLAFGAELPKKLDLDLLKKAGKITPNKMEQFVIRSGKQVLYLIDVEKAKTTGTVKFYLKMGGGGDYIGALVDVNGVVGAPVLGGTVELPVDNSKGYSPTYLWIKNISAEEIQMSVQPNYVSSDPAAAEEFPRVEYTGNAFGPERSPSIIEKMLAGVLMSVVEALNSPALGFASLGEMLTDEQFVSAQTMEEAQPVRNGLVALATVLLAVNLAKTGGRIAYSGAVNPRERADMQQALVNLLMAAMLVTTTWVVFDFVAVVNQYLTGLFINGTDGSVLAYEDIDTGSPLIDALALLVFTIFNIMLNFIYFNRDIMLFLLWILSPLAAMAWATESRQGFVIWFAELMGYGFLSVGHAAALKVLILFFNGEGAKWWHYFTLVPTLLMATAFMRSLTLSFMEFLGVRPGNGLMAGLGVSSAMAVGKAALGSMGALAGSLTGGRRYSVTSDGGGFGGGTQGVGSMGAGTGGGAQGGSQGVAQGGAEAAGSLGGTGAGSWRKGTSVDKAIGSGVARGLGYAGRMMGAVAGAPFGMSNDLAKVGEAVGTRIGGSARGAGAAGRLAVRTWREKKQGDGSPSWGAAFKKAVGVKPESSMAKAALYAGGKVVGSSLAGMVNPLDSGQPRGQEPRFSSVSIDGSRFK